MSELKQANARQTQELESSDLSASNMHRQLSGIDARRASRHDSLSLPRVSAPAINSALQEQVPWAGFYRALQEGSERTSSTEQLQHQRYTENRWASFLGGKRLMTGHPARQLYGIDVVVPPRTGTVLESSGHDLQTVRKDLIQYASTLRPVAESNVNVPERALEILDQFRFQLTRADLRTSDLARLLTISESYLDSNSLHGATVASNIPQALNALAGQVTRGSATLTPILVGLPPSGINYDMLNRTIVERGTFVGLVPKLNRSARELIPEVREMFGVAANFIENGGSGREQRDIANRLLNLRAELLRCEAKV